MERSPIIPPPVLQKVDLRYYFNRKPNCFVINCQSLSAHLEETTHLTNSTHPPTRLQSPSMEDPLRHGIKYRTLLSDPKSYGDGGGFGVVVCLPGRRLK